MEVRNYFSGAAPRRGGPLELSLRQACGLYMELTGWRLGVDDLKRHVKSFPHLGVFRTACGSGAGDVWSDDADDNDADDIFKLVGVDERRFRYFVATRSLMVGGGAPALVFNQHGLSPGDIKARLSHDA
jgi:hypothetical protein